MIPSAAPLYPNISQATGPGSVALGNDQCSLSHEQCFAVAAVRQSLRKVELSPTPTPPPPPPPPPNLYAPPIYACQLFLSQRREIFSCRVPVSEDDPTIAEDFRKLPRKFRRIPKFLRLGSTEKEQSSWLFSLKIGEPGIKT